MSRLFGTDGVRGLANRDLTAQLALDLSMAAAQVFSAKSTEDRARAIIGRDPRASGEFLEAAVAAGLASAGVDVFRAGVLPTPGIAFLTKDLGADFGVMLSASHNPMPDNGIKFFAGGGDKLPDDVEDAIEAAVGSVIELPTGAGVGRIADLAGARFEYLAHLEQAITHDLNGLTIVVDCANGAASTIAPAAYEQAGAKVITIHSQPDGLNINRDCGSTHMEDLVAAVIEHEADMGLAHDGDADRCLAVDAQGQIVDGDQILAVLAVAMKERGSLKSNTVVGTVMANLGFKIAMREQGIDFVETAVGDRYVLEAMRANDYSLGGEQSGHVIAADFATTGDGVLTGLLLAEQVAATATSLADLAAVVNKLPQVLINVANVDKQLALADDAIADCVREAEAELGDTGRVLLRPSGTEALVRVMVEAASADVASAVAERIAETVRSNAAAR